MLLQLWLQLVFDFVLVLLFGSVFVYVFVFFELFISTCAKFTTCGYGTYCTCDKFVHVLHLPHDLMSRYVLGLVFLFYGSITFSPFFLILSMFFLVHYVLHLVSVFVVIYVCPVPITFYENAVAEQGKQKVGSEAAELPQESTAVLLQIWEQRTRYYNCNKSRRTHVHHPEKASTLSQALDTTSS